MVQHFLSKGTQVEATYQPVVAKHNDSEAWLLGQGVFLTEGRHFRFADHAFLLNGIRYALHFCGTVTTLPSPRRSLLQGSAFLLNG